MIERGDFRISEIRWRSGCYRYEYRSSDPESRVCARKAFLLASRKAGGRVVAAGGGGGALHWEVSLPRFADPAGVSELAAATLRDLGPAGVFSASCRDADRSWAGFSNRTGRDEIFCWIKTMYRDAPNGGVIVSLANSASDVAHRRIRIDGLVSDGALSPERAATARIYSAILAGGERMPPIVVSWNGDAKILDGRLRVEAAKIKGGKTICAVVLHR